MLGVVAGLVEGVVVDGVVDVGVAVVPAGVAVVPVVEVVVPVLLFSVDADWSPPPSPPQAASITGTSRERANGAMLRIGMFLVRFFRLRGNRDGTDGDGAAATRVASRRAGSGVGAGRQVRARRTSGARLGAA
ncbi:hypothetical protein C5O80_27240 [Burkholderia sp. SRS-46]|nr:hypothetical protein C5O80_27240 [Burkholderia sp. SRS-46]